MRYVRSVRFGCGSEVSGAQELTTLDPACSIAYERKRECCRGGTMRELSISASSSASMKNLLASPFSRIGNQLHPKSFATASRRAHGCSPMKAVGTLESDGRNRARQIWSPYVCHRKSDPLVHRLGPGELDAIDLLPRGDTRARTCARFSYIRRSHHCSVPCLVNYQLAGAIFRIRAGNVID